MSIPFHPKTERLLQAYIGRPNTSLLLIGDNDDGVDDGTDYLAGRLLDKSERRNILTLGPEKESIGIEAIREIKQFLTTKQSKNSAVSRICVIQRAETLTTEAQNALLKVLEEPIEGSLIILQASSSERLLPTITSRCQTIPILPLTKAQTEKRATTNAIDTKTLLRLQALSERKRALFARLLTDSAETPEHIAMAKSFLASNTFERLAHVSSYDNREALQALIADLQKVARAAMKAARNDAQLKRWQAINEILLRLQDDIRMNVIPKLIFLKLCTKL